MTRLNETQLAALAPYEEPMRTAYRADYVHRVPGRRALELINQIVVEATGHDQSFNPGCSACILRLMKLAGRLYFETLEAVERERQAAIDKANDAEAAKLSRESAQRPEIKAQNPKTGKHSAKSNKAQKTPV